MRLYLDDDSAAALLAHLLRHAGHDVQVPADVGLSGEEDAVDLTYAVKEDRGLPTGNHRVPDYVTTPPIPHTVALPGRAITSHCAMLPHLPLRHFGRPLARCRHHVACRRLRILPDGKAISPFR